MTSLLMTAALATALSVPSAGAPALRPRPARTVDAAAQVPQTEPPEVAGQVPAAEPAEMANQAPTPVPASERLVDRTFKGPLGKEYLFLEESIRCNCGCGLTVHECLYQKQCSTSPKFSKRIRDELNAGYSPKVIMAGFVADYGQSILAVTPATGFNLVGYLLPGFAILTVGTLVGLVIRGAAGRQTQVATIQPEELSDEDRARLAAELKRLEELDSPDW